jgi:N-acetylglucosaminyl-diphospho-decaprenol L-rhamnosyltransferase
LRGLNRDTHAAPVTIAIVSWNTQELLRRALESLAPEFQAGRAGVWVVDNDSDDGSADLVRDEFPWVELIASRQNLGFGRAVNLVAKRTESEWIAPANADIALRPGALARLLETGRADPQAGAVAPRLVLPGERTQHSVFAFPTIPFALAFATGVYRHSRTLGDRRAFVGHWDSERARRVPWAVGAFLLVRRTAWNEIGGFDERQWMYAEDLDLGWRLHRAGWATRYEPRAHVDHEHAAATTQLFGSKPEARWQRSTYGFLARRRGVAYAWTIALINAFGASMRCLQVALRPLRGQAPDPELRRAHARWALVHLRSLRGRDQLEALE